VVVSRTRPLKPSASVVILTPEPGLSAGDLQAYPKGVLTLIVLPKWLAAPDPIRRGFVRKVAVIPGERYFQDLLRAYAPETRLAYRSDRIRPDLDGVGGAFAWLPHQRPGRIDSLRTISGKGWTPLIVDERGQAVLVQSTKSPSIWVLADPDLLNNQGLGDRDTARLAWTILDVARGGDRPIQFDVTLNGYARGRTLGRMFLEPPYLAATLCAVAAAMLMGFHALARFGQPRRRGRAFALGARALVDNSADLVRMARKEHELAPAYAALIQALVARSAGGHQQQQGWLDDLAARRGAAAPGALAAEAETTKTRDDLLSIAKKLYEWRGEMTRERR